MSADSFRRATALPDPEQDGTRAAMPATGTVRAARPEDVDALALLAQELLAFYGLPARNQRSYMAHVMSAELFERESNLKILVAESSSGLSGFLAYVEVFALANCQRSFFIQDLFVTRRARAGGVGGALMGELLRLADEGDVAQIDWTADPWNEKAVAFYEKIGPLLKSDKILYRLAGPSLRRSMQDQKR
ncbi:MAG: GNAT family N-acetyltransferase [Nisaea sp.]|uniref:GNAT family N-acetyltransferase n=1 Tax=Nisaea sp. TaxID=2024842 RepID=UPI001B19331D|nr:GNAT family N-acetyltransferase [Nisaea sp.]MBO6558925.1 GNAT family N-acetyltransferase [Nisaea sp.]